MIKSEFCATLIKVCCRLSKVIIWAIGFNGIFLWIRIRILHNKPENSYTEYQIYFTKQIALRTAKTSEQMHMNLKVTWSSSKAGSILHFYIPPIPTATPTMFLQWSRLGPLPLSPGETLWEFLPWSIHAYSTSPGKGREPYHKQEVLWHIDSGVIFTL